MSSSTQSREHHAGIHGLRGACVLAIFVYHVVNSGLLPPAASRWAELVIWLSGGLRYGVEVFFMISGYVIVQSLRRHDNAVSFMRDRVLRIFPLWLPLASAMLLGVLLWSQWSGTTVRTLPSALTLVPSLLILAPVLPVPSIHPAQWSLSYELFFYAFCAVLWRVRSRAAWLRLLCLIPPCVFAVLFPRALFFLPGVLVALHEPWLRSRSTWFRVGWLGLPMAWVAWLSTGVEDASLSRTLIDFAMDGQAAAVLVALTGAGLFFAWVVLFRARSVGIVLASSAMQWLGTVSFSFYLVHPIVMGVVKRMLPTALHADVWTSIALFSVISFAIACVASSLTWKFLEVGLRRWLLSLRSTQMPLAVRR